jgi:hypothetical protein
MSCQTIFLSLCLFLVLKRELKSRTWIVTYYYILQLITHVYKQQSTYIFQCPISDIAVLEGNISNEVNMAKWTLRNGVICVTSDCICSTSALYVFGNTLHLNASQQSKLSPNKDAACECRWCNKNDVVVSLLTSFQYTNLKLQVQH